VFPHYKFDENMVRFLTSPEISDTKPKITTSLRFAHKLRKKYSLYSNSFDMADWKRLDLMESSVGQGSAILFCGGPVVSLAWATFPQKYRGPEVLAVCCKNDPDNFSQLPDLATPQKCLIQLWMFENMHNAADVTKATLKYAIACDNGPMRDMKFCPSGGYDSAANRLGLLAAATVNGVSIYALPLQLDIKDSRSEIISLQPVQVLNMDGLPAICIDWAVGRSRLAAGFSNGVMAVWNLDVRTKLLRFEENGVQGLNPVKWAKATQSAITSIRFHMSGDACYLLVTSLDRRLKVYDLDTSFLPMEIASYTAKSRILTADWSPHWSSFIFALDESLMLGKKRGANPSSNLEG
jgi:general transcription factor 3C polypeptide 2